MFGDWTQENTAARLASGKDDLVFSDGSGKESGWQAQTTQNGSGGRTIEMLDTGNANNNAIQLGHEAYRDGKASSNNKQETRDAVRAHTEMAARMLADGQKLGYNNVLANDISNYLKGIDAFNAYVDGNYDSSKDYQKNPSTQRAPKFQSGAPYAYTSPALVQFYEDAARRGDQVELLSATSGIFVNGLLAFGDKVLNDGKGLKKAQEFEQKANEFFYSLQIEEKKSGFFDFDKNGFYSNSEVKEYINKINGSVYMNYGTYLHEGLGPYRVNIPVLGTSDANAYLNNRKWSSYSPEMNLMVLQVIRKGKKNGK